jgi:coenzyme F420-reducing hydrogenase beta subunit
MINIDDKTKCCGCSTCFNICPKEAIRMEYDSEGFLYPKIDDAKCIKCGLCLKVCPITNNKKENKVLDVYGAKNKNIDEQLKSSSGGMFSIFANYMLDNNGIVFGASFDSNWKVVHKYIDKKEDLDDLRRSKYVQSDINVTYKQAKQFLENKRLVLFTGTPCQIAGLKNYLQKDYDNLIAIEIFCHSVPSPLIWKMWLNNNFNINDINKIDFRNKEIAWDKSLFKIYFKDNTFYPKIPIMLNFVKKFIPLRIYNFLRMNLKPKNYRDAFLSSLISRPSCHSCKFKTIEKSSDISIGDLWRRNKLAPNMIYDKNGLSIITINSNKGLKYFNLLKDKLVIEKIDFDKLLFANPYFLTSVKPNKKREEFFKRYHSENLNELIPELLNEKPLVIKVFRKIFKKFLNSKSPLNLVK